MIGHKASLTKFKKIEIISSIFSNYNILKLETNFKEKIQKYSHSLKLNSMLLNNEWINNNIKEEIIKFLETNENELTPIKKPLGHSKGSPEREVHIDTGLPEKHRNISNKQPNHTPART